MSFTIDKITSGHCVNIRTVIFYSLYINSVTDTTATCIYNLYQGDDNFKADGEGITFSQNRVHYVGNLFISDNL